MTKFFEALANVFRIPDLRKRVLFTLGLLAVYRIGAYIPTPGIDTNRFQQFFTRNAAGGFLGYFDLFSGGMLRRMTIFALGITPYITASIILQLLTVVIPDARQTAERRRTGTPQDHAVDALSDCCCWRIVQSFGIAFALQNSDGNFVCTRASVFLFMTMLTFTAGSAFIMWLGEQITDRGIGNGMSLIIFVGIVVGLPTRDQQHLHQYVRDAPVAGAADGHHSDHDGRGGRVYRAGRTRRAAHSGAVCQARYRPPHDGRPIDPPAAESKCRRRDPDHLRLVAACLAADRLAVPASSRTAPG